MAEAFKATLRKLETIGKPVVAALNGSALGGGLEIVLLATIESRLIHPGRSLVFLKSRLDYSLQAGVSRG